MLPASDYYTLKHRVLGECKWLKIVKFNFMWYSNLGQAAFLNGSLQIWLRGSDFSCSLHNSEFYNSEFIASTYIDNGVGKHKKE